MLLEPMKNPIPYMQSEWQAMTPSQKALAVTCGLFATAISPLYPAVYFGAYAVYSAHKADEDSADD
jgi:hypothetical protein